MRVAARVQELEQVRAGEREGLGSVLGGSGVSRLDTMWSRKRYPWSLPVMGE